MQIAHWLRLLSEGRHQCKFRQRGARWKKKEKHNERLEKVAIAMHCNLRSTDVAPVVLALRGRGPIIHQRIKFQDNLLIHS